MNRSAQSASVILVVAFAGCHHSPAKVQTTAQATAPTPSRVAMDSAEIERLCLHPDRVRAGRADCVLKDQGVRRERPLPAPTPPR